MVLSTPDSDQNPARADGAAADGSAVTTPGGLVCLTVALPPALPLLGSAAPDRRARPGTGGGRSGVAAGSGRTGCRDPHDAGTSELARWLHGRRWPVQMVAGRTHLRTSRLGDVPVDLLADWGQTYWPQGLDEASAAVTGLAFRLRRLRPWVVHAFQLADAAGAILAGKPYVLSIRDVIPPDEFTGQPGLWQLFRLATGSAARVVTPSRYAADHLFAMYGVESTVVPDGIDTAVFTPRVELRRRHLVYAPVAADDPQANAAVAVQAFVAMARHLADAELVVHEPARVVRRGELLAQVPPDVRLRIHLVSADSRERRARWYGEAAVTCIPAVGVASGRLAAESLAAGTPVAVADSGGLPEIVGAGIGGVFDPMSPAACSAALADAVRLARRPGTADACRRAAAAFDWNVVGGRLTELYRVAGDVASVAPTA